MRHLFKTWLGQTSRRVALTLLPTGILVGALCQEAPAAITGPYSVDANTLGLYHFDEASGGTDPGNPIVNFGSSGSGLNMTNTGGFNGRDDTGGGGYGAAALPSFGTSFNVLASGNNAYHTATVSNGGGLLTTGAVTQASLQGADGAFTYEALVQFNAAVNIDGNDYHILAHDGGGTNRGFLFRTLGTGGIGRLSFYNGVTDTTVLIPTSGDNAFAQNEWFHVAVTYNGNAGAAGNLAFYWTRVGANPDAANLIGTGTMAADLSAATSDGNNLGIGTTTRFQFRTELYGLIDEVRLSNIARGPVQFAFAAVPEPSTWIAIGLCGSWGCLLIRRKNSC